MTEETGQAEPTEVFETENENHVPIGLRLPSLAEIASMLDEAGIDYIPLLDEDRLYVTAFAFNFWIRIHEQSGAVFLTTNWDLNADANELELLRHINRLNDRFPLVQFAWDEEGHRLTGHAWLSARGGIARAVLIRTAIRFASIFKEALDMTCSGGFAGDENSMATIN